jgi:transcriptional regulator with XRE-family HTH domain
MSHAKKLKELRLSKGYSTRQLAEAAGVSTRTIWELENRRRVPQPRTMRRLAEGLDVALKDVEEFREAIRHEASRGVPPEVLAQADEMEEVFEVDLVDASFMRVAAQRSLKEVMAYLIRSGHPEDVKQIYGELCGEDAGQKGQVKGTPSSSGADVSIERTKPDAG